MIQIVDRYCKDFLKRNDNLSELKKQLETYIHAIEIEKEELNVCSSRCEKVANLYNIYDVNWDFINADTLSEKRYERKMDFVIGNPPYVRVHNLNDDFESVKNFEFGNGGMTDLYIVFYEIGIRMLNSNGILCYITPSSFFTSVAGTNMRKFLNEKLWLESICDLKHFQPFNAITYTTIVCINKTKKEDTIEYFEFDVNEVFGKKVCFLLSMMLFLFIKFFVNYLCINDSFFFF